MPVTISPPLLLELNKNSWDTPYFQEDVVRGPYVINYESSDASTNNDLKIEFSHEGPLRFCLSDGETSIDAPVYIRNSGTFLFKVRVNYQILNEQANNITFRGLVKTTEESQTTSTTTTIPEPWYELKFVPPSAVAVFENQNPQVEVMVYLQLMTVNNTGQFVATRTLWPEDDFVVTAVDQQSEDSVELISQEREEADRSTQKRIKLVFEDQLVHASASYAAKFIVKLAEEYKDRNGQSIEAELTIRKDVTGFTGGSTTDPDDTVTVIPDPSAAPVL